MANLTQPSFAAGELSPALYSRTDLAKYHIGVRTMLNWYVHPQGGTSNCPGTAWVGEVIDSAVRGRLIPFQFSTVQTYALEFGDRAMRVIRDGGYVLESSTAITAITQANPGSVTTLSPHGYASGDRIWLTGIAGMTQLNGRYANITVTGANSFTIGIDTTAYGAFTSGSIARLYTLATPYLEADLPTLKYEQSADTMTICHKNYPVAKLTRSDHASWILTDITFAPTQPAPTGLVSSFVGTLVYYVVTAINLDSGEESLASNEAGSSVETSVLTWDALAGVSAYSVYKKKNGVYGFIGQAQSPASGSATFTDTTILPDTSITPPQQRQPFGQGVATGVDVVAGGSGFVAPTGELMDGSTAVTTVAFTVAAGAITSGTLADTTKPVSPNAYITISEAGGGTGAVLAPQWTDALDDYGSYISGVTVVNGGSGYSATPEVHSLYYGIVDYGGYRFSATVVAGVITAASVTVTGFGSWSPAEQAQLTIVASDPGGTGAIVEPVIAASNTTNPSVTTYHDGRQWFAASASQPQTMWGSVAGAFNNMSVSVPTRDSDAITRTLASRQVNNICALVSLANGMIALTGGAEWRISAGSSDVITPAAFVARPQSYNGSSDIRPIVANDVLLYIPANRQRVRSLQYQWAADTWTGTDMSLLASHLFEHNEIFDWAYARDPDSIAWTVRSDGIALAFTYLPEQQLYAWSRRTTTGGFFESVCAIQEGAESATYFIVRRGSRRFVERMQSRVFENIAECWFLDAALRYEGSPAATIGGLFHLAGQEVWALADGIVRGPMTVTAAGTVTLPAAAALVTIGKILPDADLELLDIDGKDQAGAWTGRKVKIADLTVALRNSANVGLVAGPSGGQGAPTLYPIRRKDLVNPLAAAPSTNPALVTDFMVQIAAPQWSWHGRALFRVHNSPLPYSISGITPDVSAGG